MDDFLICPMFTFLFAKNPRQSPTFISFQQKIKMEKPWCPGKYLTSSSLRAE